MTADYLQNEIEQQNSYKSMGWKLQVISIADNQLSKQNQFKPNEINNCCF